MTPEQIKSLQSDLAARGAYTGAIDGLWGPQSQAAWAEVLAGAVAAPAEPRIIEQLRRDEGEVLSAYQDHLGFWTIGIGRLIDKRKGGGITRSEAAYLLGNDLTKVARQVTERLPWAAGLDEARRGVLINMAFQMGIDGLAAFKNTLALVQTGQYATAADGMLNSKWATQTPQRAKRLATQMRTGVWQ